MRAAASEGAPAAPPAGAAAAAVARFRHAPPRPRLERNQTLGSRRFWWQGDAKAADEGKDANGKGNMAAAAAEAPAPEPAAEGPAPEPAAEGAAPAEPTLQQADRVTVEPEEGEAEEQPAAAQAATAPATAQGAPEAAREARAPAHQASGSARAVTKVPPRPHAAAPAPSSAAGALVQLARSNPSVHAALKGVQRDKRTGAVTADSLARVIEALKSTTCVDTGGSTAPAARVKRYPAVEKEAAARASGAAEDMAAAVLAGARRAVDEWVARGGASRPRAERAHFAEYLREYWAGRLNRAPPSLATAKAKAEVTALISRAVLGEAPTSPTAASPAAAAVASSITIQPEARAPARARASSVGEAMAMAGGVLTAGAAATARAAVPGGVPAAAPSARRPSVADAMAAGGGVLLGEVEDDEDAEGVASPAAAAAAAAAVPTGSARTRSSSVGEAMALCGGVLTDDAEDLLEREEEVAASPTASESAGATVATELALASPAAERAFRLVEVGADSPRASATVPAASPGGGSKGRFVPSKLEADNAHPIGGGFVPAAYVHVPSPGPATAAGSPAPSMSTEYERVAQMSLELVETESAEGSMLLEPATGTLYSSGDVPLPVGRLVNGAVVRPAEDVCVRAGVVGDALLGGASRAFAPTAAAAAAVAAMGYARPGDVGALAVVFALAARAGGRPTLPAAAAVEAVREGAAAAQAPTSALMSLLARIKAELQTRTRQPLRALALAFQQFASANVGGKGAEGMLTHLEAVAMLAVLLPEMREAPLEGGPSGQAVLLAHMRSAERAERGDDGASRLGSVSLADLARLLRLVPIVRPRPTRAKPRMPKVELPQRSPRAKRDGRRDASFWGALEALFIRGNTTLQTEFAKHDKDKSGALEWPELRRFIKAVMPDAGVGDLKYLRGALGIRGRGDASSFKELVETAKVMRAAATSLRTGERADGSDALTAVYRALRASMAADGVSLQTAFRSYDKDGSGQLEPLELRLMFCALCSSLSVRDVRLVIANMHSVDTNGDGKISLKELRVAMARATKAEAAGAKARASEAAQKVITEVAVPIVTVPTAPAMAVPGVGTAMAKEEAQQVVNAHTVQTVAKVEVSPTIDTAAEAAAPAGTGGSVPLTPPRRPNKRARASSVGEAMAMAGGVLTAGAAATARAAVPGGVPAAAPSARRPSVADAMAAGGGVLLGEVEDDEDAEGVASPAAAAAAAAAVPTGSARTRSSSVGEAMALCGGVLTDDAEDLLEREEEVAASPTASESAGAPAKPAAAAKLSFGGAMGFSFGTPASEAATAPEPSVYAAPAPVAAAERSLPAHGEDLPPRRERRYTLGDLINGIAH